MKDKLIAFDFDGTLVQSGDDKVVHVMYAAYAACRESGLRRFLDDSDVVGDLQRISGTHLKNTGAPRFNQFAAIVNTLVNGSGRPVRSADELGLTGEDATDYARARARFNELYSALNDAAARLYWRVFPSAMATLRELAVTFDLAIASGVTQDILEADLAQHGFDAGLFIAVRGGDVGGGSNKGDILKELKGRGYADVLFVGDSTKDQAYAAVAGVKFFRVTTDIDFPRLLEAVKGRFPDEREPWTWTEAEKTFFARKTLRLMERHAAGTPLTPDEATQWIHA
jgi:phosphoglycolate phosphatase-like HAD superfamily hydrolase